MRATWILLNALLTLALVFCFAAGGERRLPGACGQAAVTPDSSGTFQVMQGASGDTFAVLYDAQSKHLVSYLIARDGIKLRGIREVTWDLMVQEMGSLPPQGMTVKDVKALVK
jgi:hypothetical protein